MNITCQEVEICIQKLSTRSFYHLLSDFQSEFSAEQKNDSYRMFAKNSNSFDLQSRQIKSLSSHIFDTCNLKYVFTILKSHTNSHYVISQCDDFIWFKTIEFEIFKFTHVRESLSRSLSISIHVFRLSKISHSFSICRRCQEHFVIYLFSSWLTSIVLRIENNKIFMKISTLKKSSLKKF